MSTTQTKTKKNATQTKPKTQRITMTFTPDDAWYIATLCRWNKQQNIEDFKGTKEEKELESANKLLQKTHDRFKAKLQKIGYL
jgi:hypothetical protein